MNAEIFEETDYYFKQILKLIIYGYEQVKKDRKKKPYSRKEIYEIIKEVREKEKVHFEIEDYLRNDLVKQYLNDFKNDFELSTFLILSGSEEFKCNVKIGIVDIRFVSFSATSLDNTGFILECKRLNKFSEMLKSYIEGGMMRFITKQYYAESDVTLAGMIAFVEVDLVKHKDGFMPINEIEKHVRSYTTKY